MHLDRTLPTLLASVVFAAFVPFARAGDLSFISGRYAVSADDCQKITAGKPFSDEWVAALDSEVLTSEGVTSPRETHCKFKSSEGGSGTWKVKSACEELGQVSEVDVGVSAGEAGALVVTQEDWFGEPLTFKPCGK